MSHLLLLPDMKIVTLHRHKAGLFRYFVPPMEMDDTYDLETRAKSSRISMLFGIMFLFTEDQTASVLLYTAKE